MPINAGLLVTSEKEAVSVIQSMKYLSDKADEFIRLDDYKNLDYFFRSFLKKYADILATHKHLLLDYAGDAEKGIAALQAMQQKIQNMVSLGKMHGFKEYYEKIEVPEELQHEVARQAARHTSELEEIRKDLSDVTNVSAAVDQARSAIAEYNKLVGEMESAQRRGKSTGLTVERIKQSIAKKIDDAFATYQRYLDLESKAWAKSLKAILRNQQARAILAKDSRLQGAIIDAFNSAKGTLEELFTLGLVKEEFKAKYKAILKPVSFTSDYALAA